MDDEIPFDVQTASVGVFGAVGIICIHDPLRDEGEFGEDGGVPLDEMFLHIHSILI